MIHRLALDHPRGSTPILVGPGALAAAAEELAAWAAGRTLFVISTPRVLGLHGEVLRPLERAAGRAVVLEVDDGEEAKSLATAGRLWQEMLAAGGKRDSRLVAFGGGSCGDLGGFVAGCFLRGIEYVQVPTTLLAQVDASIGGKTAIDLPAAKNSVGLFHHPARVVADTDLLPTLPAAELRSGLVEVVKVAFLLDPELLGRVEDDLPRLVSGDPEALGPIAAEAAAVKVGVVERDPEESGDRRLLNFGHTLGHAIETVTGYRHLRHGEAVAYGLLFSLRLALRRGLPVADAGRLHRLLERFDLPPLPPLDADRLVAAARRDKKAREDGLTWVLASRLGAGRLSDDVSEEEMRAELERFLADPWRAPSELSNSSEPSRNEV